MPDTTPAGGQANDDEVEATVHSFPETPLVERHASLGRGVVWADILADIAADERARTMRDAA